MAAEKTRKQNNTDAAKAQRRNYAGGAESERARAKASQSSASSNKKGSASKPGSKSKKAKKRRRRRIRRLVCLIIIAAVAAGAFCYNCFRSYDSYSVSETLSISNGTSFIEIESFKNGYVKITESSAAYFNKSGVSWTQAYSMSQPVYDICGGYIAVADVTQNEIYLFDKDGLVNTVPTQYSVIDVEVSRSGVIAAATDDDEANYIEIYDKTGSELITARSIFSSSGYLADISLSADGTKLAAAFINVDLLDIVSRVAFYDFSEGSEDSDVLVASFQYTDTVITNVEFLGTGTVAAIGDNAVSIYDFSSSPEVVYEDTELTETIQSVVFGEKYFALITDDDSGEYNYQYIVYNRSGKIAAQKGFDFSYTDVVLYGRNIMLFSSNACRIYNFAGVEKFSCAFEEDIEAMYPAGYSSLIYATASETNFIRMK